MTRIASDQVGQLANRWPTDGLGWPWLAMTKSKAKSFGSKYTAPTIPSSFGNDKLEAFVPMAEPAPKKAKVEGDGSRSGEAGAQNPDAGGADAGAGDGQAGSGQAGSQSHDAGGVDDDDSDVLHEEMMRELQNIFDEDDVEQPAPKAKAKAEAKAAPVLSLIHISEPTRPY